MFAICSLSHASCAAPNNCSCNSSCKDILQAQATLDTAGDHFQSGSRLSKHLLCLCIQVNKNTKQVQQRKARAAPSYADDTNAASDAPKRWSDYTVQFEFPEPTELPPPLIQLNDVSFQYPGRDDFGLIWGQELQSWGPTVLARRL